MILEFLMMIFSILAVIFIAMGIAIPISANVRKKKCTVATTGILVEWKLIRETVDNVVTDTDDMRYRTEEAYWPIYEYFYNGTKYRKKGNHSCNRPGVTGVKVPIYLDPKDPNVNYVDTKFEKDADRIAPIVIGVVGVVLLAAITVVRVVVS